MTTMTFPTRTKHYYWTAWNVADHPAFLDACNRVLGLPPDHPAAMSTAHAALLLLDRDCILMTGGFDD